MLKEWFPSTSQQQKTQRRTVPWEHFLRIADHGSFSGWRDHSLGLLNKGKGAGVILV